MRHTISDDVFEVGPIVDYYGSKPKYSIPVPGTAQGAASISDDLEMIVYSYGKDVSSNRTTGSITRTNTAGSDPVVTTKTFQNLADGETLFVLIRGTVDGVFRTIVVFDFIVLKEGGRSDPQKNDPFMISPRGEYYGAEPEYSFSVPGVDTVTDDSTLEIAISRNGKDIMASRSTGSISVVNTAGINPVITTPVIDDLEGGEELFILIRGTCDTVLRTIVTFWLFVKKESGK